MNIPLKILHLEDNAQEAEMIRLTLNKENLLYQYLLVDNKSDYHKALHEFSPDVILSDHKLPSFGSSEALQMAKEHHTKIPFVLVTGTVSEEYAVEVMNNGASDYILKDHLQRLPAAVLNAVEKNRYETENKRHVEKLVINDALYRETERMAQIGSWEADLTSGAVKWSDQMYRIFGLEPGEIEPSHENMLAYTHPEDSEYVRTLTEESMRGLHSNIKFTYRIIAKDKSIKHICKELVVKKDDNGRPVKMVGFNLDITQTQMAVEALRQSEANLRSIFDNTDISYLLLDNKLNIVSFNKLTENGFATYLGKSISTGQNILNFLPEKRLKATEARYKEVLNGIPFEFETFFIRPDDLKVWYHVRLSPVFGSNNNIIGMVMALEDITQRKNNDLEKEKLSEELKESHRGLKKLVTKVQKVKEEERLQIAKEVQEELGQLLLATKHEVSSIKRKLSTSPEHAYLQLEFANTLKTIDKSIKSVQKIATDLRPEMLDKLGLTESINWEVEEFRKNTNMECCLSISQDFTDLSLDINKSTTIYRIVQKSLSNIRKHAAASKVKIIIKLSNKNIFMVINDNGIGITNEQKNTKNASGLTDLRERVLLLNGIIDFTGQTDTGTIVYVQIPYAS